MVDVRTGRDLSPRMLLLGLLLAITCFYGNLARDSYQDDFRAFYVAGLAVHDHLDPYQNQVNVSERYADSLWSRVDSRYIYPPTALLVFEPMRHASYKLAKTAFGFGMALVMVGVLMGLERRFPRQGMVLLALFISLPMFMHVDNGQIDALMLALALAAFYLGDEGWRGLGAGACLGVAIAIKFSPVLVLLWFVGARRWRTVGAAVVVCGAICAVAGVRWGWGYFPEFLHHMMHHEDPGMPMLQHTFETVKKIGNPFLITTDGIYAYQHDIGGYMQNPLHRLGRYGGWVGITLFAWFELWLLRSKRGRALGAERGFFLFLVVALLPNTMLWTMGLVACFPLIVLLVDESDVPNRAAVMLLVPFFLTKQVVWEWNFVLWMVMAAVVMGWNGWFGGRVRKAEVGDAAVVA